MARFRFLTRLKRAWLASKQRGLAGFASGFTLIELLVSMIIAAIITVSLLSLVVGLVDVNKRDAEQTEVQQSMQAAMDYISEELREAIFVYDDKCIVGQGSKTNPTSVSDCPGLVNHLPPSVKDNIVLAFWRTNLLPLDVLQTCDDYSKGGAGGAPRLNSDDVRNGYAVKDIPCIAGRGYTLVAYTLKKGTTDVWRGKARLERYQLTQFNADGTAVTGYVDPLNSAELGDLRFKHWPYQKEKDTSAIANKQSGLPTGTPAVLVDFLDDTPANSTCPDLSHPTYISDGAGFSACVRGRIYYNAVGLTQAQIDAQEAEQDVKQEIVVSLKGAVPERKGNLFSELGSAADKKLAPLQTRVLSRSILR
jgi:prepilin-type N-terminal cleavage/methylation domain-containing protein